MIYQITDLRKGGTFETSGDSEDHALDIFAQDRGFLDYADARAMAEHPARLAAYGLEVMPAREDLEIEEFP